MRIPTLLFVPVKSILSKGHEQAMWCRDYIRYIQETLHANVQSMLRKDAAQSDNFSTNHKPVDADCDAVETLSHDHPPPIVPERTPSSAMYKFVFH